MSLEKRPTTELHKLNRHNVDVATPADLYDALDAIYHFDHDPCPLHGASNRVMPTGDWGNSNYVNPPFRDIKWFLLHNVQQLAAGRRSVFLIPARFDTKYWAELVYPYATEIYYLNSHVRFRGYDKPFPSTIVVIEFDPNKPARFRLSQLGNYQVATAAEFSQTL